jgi:4-amino-4-deoxy-L-arabinose transferase-like glycosyltransferase
VSKIIRYITSKEIRMALVILIISITVRLIYFFEIKSNPFFENPITDSLWHDQWALAITQGDWLGTQAFFRAPLYPYFLAFLYFIFGHDYMLPRLIQFIFGSISCVLIYLISKRLFNRSVGIIAALISAFYGVFIYFEGELLITSLVIFINLLLFYVLLRGIKKPSRLIWVLAGILFGLSAIARPTILIFLLGILAWLVIEKRKIQLKAICLCIILGACIIILPVTLRNYLVEKDFVLISSQGGINYFIGNNPGSDGKTALAPSMDKPPQGVEDHIWFSSVKVAERNTGKSMKSSEISTYWFKRGLDFGIQNPVAFIKLQFRKLYYFWNAFELESNKNIYMYRKFSQLFKILVWVFGIAFPFGIICPLSIVGMLLCRKKWRKLFLLYSFIFLYMLAVIAFFVTARFRMPVIPFLIIFASYAIYWFYRKINGQNYRVMIIPSVIFLISVLVVNSNFYGVRETNILREHWLLGYAYARKASYDKAIKELKQALETPYDPFITAQTHYILGDIYCIQRRYADAEHEYIEAIRINPQHAKVYLQLGNLYSILGYIDRAEYAYRQALKIDPGFYAAKRNLELLLNKTTTP